MPQRDTEAAVRPEGLSQQEIGLRKQWLNFGPSDEHLLHEVDAILAPHLDAIIEDMYAHFFAFEQTRAFFPDEDTLDRAKTAQKRYFNRLTKGHYGVQYVQDRLRVGATHYRVDLDPKWYIGAYSHVMDSIVAVLEHAYASDPAKLLRTTSAIRKIIFFDMALAIETYIAAKEEAIRRHRDAIAELETERRVTRSILENAPLGIVTLNEECTIVQSNETFLSMLDLEKRVKITGKSLFEIAPYLPRAPFESVLASGQPYQATAEPLKFSASGSLPPDFWDWASWPVKDDQGQLVGLVAIFSNATDRVLLQQQREDFVATLTHDLKTPILAANRAVKLLAEGDFGAVSESQARILETIHESNEALYKLVQTLLDVYRYDSGAKELNLASHDLSDTIKQLIAELKPLAKAKNIELKAVLPDATHEVICDQAEVKRVIQNLLDNALKFTGPEGTITVELRSEDAASLVRVIDTGKGVKKEDLPKLFQRFWQAASHGRYYASTGLGLYLCRKIVELHKGQIWCQSTPGKGSVFAFTIPHSAFDLPAETDEAGR